MTSRLFVRHQTLTSPLCFIYIFGIAGHNGTIDGQGKSWWEKHRQKLLNHTRGPLVQIMWSSDIIISNLTLRNSPFWTLHPYDCKNVTLSNLTILAPLQEAPNTDGIDPGIDKLCLYHITHCNMQLSFVDTDWIEY